MQNDEDSNPLRASVATNAPNDQSSIPFFASSNGRTGNGQEPEPDPITMQILFFSEQAAKVAALPGTGKSASVTDAFITQRWHRPYAEVLLHRHSMHLPALISQAEQAILERYLELTITPSGTDELMDLGHAVDALAQLKGASRRSA